MSEDAAQPVQPRGAGAVPGSSGSGPSEARAGEDAGAGSRKQSREHLRGKYEQYLRESKKTDSSARHEEALERLRKDPEAAGFNLVSRMKGGQRIGLIILNRIGGAHSLPSTAETENKTEIKTEAEKKKENAEENGGEEMKTKDDDADTSDADADANEEEEEKEEERETEVKKTKKDKKRKSKILESLSPKKASTKKDTNKHAAKRVETAPKRASRPSSRKEASEALVVGLSNKVDALWRKLDHLEAKRKERKMNKAARHTMKELLMKEQTEKAPLSPKEAFYDKLDQASRVSSPSKSGVIRQFFKMF